MSVTFCVQSYNYFPNYRTIPAENTTDKVESQDHGVSNFAPDKKYQ